MNIQDIKRRNQAAGMHFFDRDTLRFFNSRISAEVYGDGFFVTSEQCYTEERKYTVRRAMPNGSIYTVSTFCEYDNWEAAHRAAKRFAGQNRVAAL